MKTLKTKRLTLRPFTYQDTDDVHIYASNPDVVKYMTFGPNTYEETKAFVTQVIDKYYAEKPVRNLEYGLEYKGRIIGGISAHLNDDFTIGEIGWILNPEYHHQGFMIEAAQALKAHVVKVYNLKRIIARCFVGNEKSRKLMEKLGMKKDSLKEKVEVKKKNGVHIVDELLYVLEL